MAVEGRWRDPFPKLDLDQNFIGDGYPICTELPTRHFLRKGATYRLAGSADRAEMEYEHPWADYDTVKRFQLDSNSNLYQVLCNASQNGGPCNFRPLIQLEENVDCYGEECGLDSWTLILVENGVKYEYVRPACVNYAFHKANELNKVVDRHDRVMCQPKAVDDVVMNACCASDNPQHWLSNNAEYFCEFSWERSSYPTAQARCQNEEITNFPNPDTCDWMHLRMYPSDQNQREGCFQYMHDFLRSWHWTNQTCTMTAKGKSTDFATWC